MKKVLIKGPILTNSGYGVHCRQIFKAMLKRSGVDLYVTPTIWGNTSWILDEAFDNGIVGKIIEYASKKSHNENFDESYQVMTPDEWTNLADVNIGVTAGFEANIVKKSWIDFVNNMNHVIVPSEFTRIAFVNTSLEFNKQLNTEIKVINEWYYDQFNLPRRKSLGVLESLDYNSNILLMSQITSSHPLSDRKNIFKTIKTVAEFIENKEIGLILKINAGKYTKEDKKNLANLLKERIGEKSLKKVRLLFGSLTISELQSLYESEKISCLVSGTRAEGWGLPFVEAASCALPIIATDYSSYKEFLGEYFLKVKYNLVSCAGGKRFVDSDARPVWAEFDRQSMLDNLDEFFSNKEFWKSKALDLQKIIKQNYNSQTIIDNYIEFFENIS